MASVSTAPNHGHPIGVGAEPSGEGVLGMGGDGGSRHAHGSMHPAPSLFEAPPTGSPRPEDPRLGHHGVRGSSSSGQSPGRGSLPTSYFEGYTLEQGLGRRSLSQRSPTSPSTQHETTSSSNAAAIVTLTTGETASTPYSNASSPTAGPSQLIFPVNESSERGASRKASRRRTGPLSAASRERAGVIRRVGACSDCRRRRVACDPSHRGLSWDEARKKTGTGSEGLRELAPVSPSTSFRPVNAIHTDAHDRMELDPSPISPESDHQPARTRRPLPTGPRLERTAQAALSLPPVDPARAHDQSGQMITLPIPTTIQSRYDTVEVLLLLWAGEHLEAVETTVEELRVLWEEQYRFNCHVCRIPPSSDAASTWKWVSDAVRGFVNGSDHRGALKIVYYNGQARFNQNQEMVLVNSPESGQACEIRWLSIQIFLQETTADIFVLMDCPYFGSNATKRHGVLEILAGGAFDDYINGPLGRCVFTRALIDHLRRRAGQTFRKPLTVAELHAELCFDYPRIYRDWRHDQEFLTKFPTPLYLQVASSTHLPSILLTPLRPESASPPDSNTTNTSRLSITVDVSSSGMNLESFKEWARLMPTGTKSVTIRGPLPASSQERPG